MSDDTIEGIEAAMGENRARNERARNRARVRSLTKEGIIAEYERPVLGAGRNGGNRMSKEEDREDLDKRLDTIRSMFTIAQEEAEKVRKAAYDAADEAYNATLYWARRAKNYSGQLEIAKFKRKWGDMI